MGSDDEKVKTERAGAAPVQVPRLLAGSAAWCGRILIVAAAIYLLVVLLGRLEIVVLSVLFALLVTALLHPIVAGLRRTGLPRIVAVLTTGLLGFAVLGGVGLFVTDRAIAQAPELLSSVSDLVGQAQRFLVNGPLHLDSNSVNNAGSQVTSFLQSRQSALIAGLVTAGRTLLDVATVVLLTVFLTIFMLYDGDGVWAWVVGLFPKGARSRADGAGHRMWHTLSGFVVGTFLVALFHGVVIGVSLLVLGAPLVAPLAVLVFIGSFIPLIGAVLFGGLAVLVTFLSNGPVDGLILLVILLVENQVEAHVLQPFVVGRSVRLHPMAVALALAAGTVLAGLPGALFAVPLAASINAGGNYLRGAEDEQGHRRTPVRILRRAAQRPRARGTTGAAPQDVSGDAKAPSEERRFAPPP